jgi:hypothetical protein
VVPAWIGIAVVGTLRAGSERLADVRGANRVAGLAIARGHALLVAAAWVSVLAAVVAIAVPALGRITAARDTGARLEMLAAFAQVAVVVTLFCGPQVAGARDAVPWVAGAALLSAGVYACSRLARWDRSVHIATVLAAVGVALALSGGRL